MQPKTYQTRIYYEDTDCGGIVYHANYLKYCERARSEWFFAQGILPQQNNIGFVVKNMNLDFLSPAKLGDLLTIHTEILEQKNASITLKQTILSWQEDTKNLLERYETKEFELKISTYKNTKNVYRVNLNYNIRFPQIYSTLAINKTFNTGIINEDKLYIEYYLMTVKIIKDLIKQDFKKQYIVEFASSLLEKEKKIKGIINIINNEAIQDKISLKIKYSDFSKNKQQVYDLMRSGFKIAVILDKSFEVNYENIEKLDMFSYVLINKDTEEYEKIEDYFKSNNNEEKYLNQVNIKIKNLIEI